MSAQEPTRDLRDLADLKPLVDTPWIVPVFYLAAITGADLLSLGGALPATSFALLLTVLAIGRWGAAATVPLVFLAGLHVAGFHAGIVDIGPSLVLVLLVATLLRLAPDPLAALAALRNARARALDAAFAFAIAAFVYTFTVLPPLQLHFQGGASELLLVLFAALVLCRRTAWFFIGLAALVFGDLLVANLVIFDCRVIDNPVLAIRAAASPGHSIGIALTAPAIAVLVTNFLGLGRTEPYRPPPAVTVGLVLLPLLVILAPHLWFGLANPLRLLGIGEAYTRISSALLHRSDVFWLAAALGLAAVAWRSPALRLAPVVLFVVSCVAGAALAPTIETLLDGPAFARVDPSAPRFMADLGPISFGLDLTGMTGANGWTRLLVTLLAGLLAGAALGGTLAGFGAARGIARLTAGAVGDLVAADTGRRTVKGAPRLTGESAWHPGDDTAGPQHASDWPQPWLQRVADAERALAGPGGSPFDILFGRWTMFAAIAAFLVGVVTLSTAETAVRAGMFRVPAIEAPDGSASEYEQLSDRCRRYLREVPAAGPDQDPVDESKGSENGTRLPDPDPGQQQQQPPSLDTRQQPLDRGGGATAD